MQVNCTAAQLQFTCLKSNLKSSIMGKLPAVRHTEAASCTLAAPSHVHCTLRAIPDTSLAHAQQATIMVE
jgi:hypothetical protein